MGATLTEDVTVSVSALAGYAIDVNDNLVITEDIQRMAENYLSVNDPVVASEDIQRLLESYVSANEQLTFEDAPTIHSTLIIKDPADIKDVYVRDGVNSGTNYDSANQIQIKKSATVNLNRYGLLEFDFAALNDGAVIEKATLRVYYLSYTTIGTDPDGETLQIRRVTQGSWVENQMTWDSYSTGNNWAVGGGDTTETNLAEYAISGGLGQWLDIDVTDMVNDSSGEVVRFQIRFKSTATDEVAIILAPSEYTTDTTQRPELVIAYSLSSTDLYKSLSDSANFTEYVSAFIGDLVLGVNDGVALNEDISRMLASEISVQDETSFTEDIQNMIESYISTNDGTTITENVDRLLESYISIYDGSTLQENIDLASELGVSVNELTNFLENYTVLPDGETLPRSISVEDGIVLQEYAEVFTNVLHLSVLDGVVTSESVERILNSYININDGTTLSEIITVSPGEPGSLVDGVMVVTFRLKGVSVSFRVDT